MGLTHGHGSRFEPPAAPFVQQDDTVKAERSHYFDLGISQVIVPGLTVGLDGCYKQATGLAPQRSRSV